MQRLTARLMVTLLMFVVGVSAYAAWTFFYHPLGLEKQVIPVSQLREDNLHKLYEAAQMTGRDWYARSMTLDKLRCARDDGTLDARMITDEFGKTGCQKDNGIVYEFNTESGAYGVIFEKVRRDHGQWSLRNLEFVREVSTPEKARDYMRQHMSELFP